jgi:hypothetical protein
MPEKQTSPQFRDPNGESRFFSDEALNAHFDELARRDAIAAEKQRLQEQRAELAEKYMDTMDSVLVRDDTYDYANRPVIGRHERYRPLRNGLKDIGRAIVESLVTGPKIGRHHSSVAVPAPGINATIERDAEHPAAVKSDDFEKAA